MAFMMKSTESTETPIHGNTVQKSLTTCQSEPSLTEKLSVFTEVSVRKSRPSTKSELLTEKLKSHMKAPSATLCGQTLRTLKTGLLTPEAQDGYSAQK